MTDDPPRADPPAPPNEPAPPDRPTPPGEPPFIPPMYRGGRPRGPWGVVVIVIIVLIGATLAVWAIGAYTGVFAQ